jgi:hypothetical protein
VCYLPYVDEFWVIDYRIPRDGKTKIEHVKDMLYTKKIECSTILMDSWYACKEIILSLRKFTIVPLKQTV